jgi:hypothetical protein
MTLIARIKTTSLVFAATSLLLASPLSLAQGASNFTPEWVQRSNEIAYKLLDSNAQFAPEFSGQTGVEGYDEEIFDLRDKLFERQIANSEKNIAMLDALLAKEEDPRVAQDIQIMIKSERDGMEANRINYQHHGPCICRFQGVARQAGSTATTKSRPGAFTKIYRPGRRI